jgi:hypothetical protein
LLQGRFGKLYGMSIKSPKWLVLAALVSAAPDTPGVYELWDDDEVIYVGATRKGSLRKQLVHELLEANSEATHFSWEISFAPAARKRELLAELRAEYRRPPKLNTDSPEESGPG